MIPHVENIILWNSSILHSSHIMLSHALTTLLTPSSSGEGETVSQVMDIARAHVCTWLCLDDVFSLYYL